MTSIFEDFDASSDFTIDHRPPKPYLVVVGDQLLLFRDEDGYGPQGPQCIAASDGKKRRCRYTVQTGEHYGGWQSPYVPEYGGQVSALDPGTAPDRVFIEQRCRKHLDSGKPDVIAPTWELFDPEAHRGLVDIHPIYVRTAQGVSMRLLGQPEVESPPDAAPVEESAIRRLLEAAIAERVDPPAITKLYTAHDGSGRLLYIGISDKMGDRLQSHVEGSSWMEFAANIAIEEFPTRKAAETAERDRVKEGRPLFNVIYNDHPSRDVDLIQYLIEKGRTDLLALNVSRG